MAEKEQGKTSAKDASYIDSAELFERLFRKELVALSAGEKGKPTLKKDTEKGMVRRTKSSSQVKSTSTKKGEPQKAPGKRKVIKRFPVSQAKAHTLKKVATKEETRLMKAVKEKTEPHLKHDKQEEVILKNVVKIDGTNDSAIGFGGKLAQTSHKVKVALLCVVLVIAVGFIIKSLGIVDFGRLSGLSDPTEKGSIKTREVRKSPTKADKQTTRVAPKSPQKRPILQSTNEVTSLKRKLIVKNPPQESPSKEQPRTIEELPKSATTIQEPASTQQRYRPATITEKPIVAQPAPQLAVPQQKPVAAEKPSQPAISKAKLVVVQETPKPAVQTKKKEVYAEAELLREETIDSYPYSVYLGSYSSGERAAKAISEYQKKGLSPYWVKVDLRDKGVWYRVFAGRYKNRDEAEALIREKGLADARVKKTERGMPTYAFLTKDKSTNKKEFKEGDRLPKTTTLSYPYSVYLGSYRTLAHAKKEISSYEKRGLSPYWVKLDLEDKGLWFRLFAGYFQKREQANEFIEEKKIEEAESRHTKYSNLIGVFESQKELHKEKIRLSKLEFCPYVIPGPNGQSRLYVGAFYQKARAQRQHAELKSKGIHSEIVER